MKIMNNKKYKLSSHFNAYDFRCKCGKSHSITIDEDLIDLLEKLRTNLKATSCTVYSGFRCTTHDKKVGGSGKGPHTTGQACDCYFTRGTKRIDCKEVCLMLEDMNHKYGIGYRCGGSKPSTGCIHIDVKKRKWYGDESKSMGQIGITSYYTYFGIKKEVFYIVKKGDSLSKIAKKYNVKWKNIAKLNNIKLPYIIKVGQKLRIK